MPPKGRSISSTVSLSIYIRTTILFALAPRSIGTTYFSLSLSRPTAPAQNVNGQLYFSFLRRSNYPLTRSYIIFLSCSCAQPSVNVIGFDSRAHHFCDIDSFHYSRFAYTRSASQFVQQFFIYLFLLKIICEKKKQKTKRFIGHLLFFDVLRRRAPIMESIIARVL